MNNIALTALLVAALSATQGLNLLLRNRSNRHFRAFAVLCGSLVVVNLATALYSSHFQPIRLWGTLRLLGAMACAITATRFFSQLLVGPSSVFRERPGYAPAGIVLGLFVLLWYHPEPGFDPRIIHSTLGNLINRPPLGIDGVTEFPPFNLAQLLSHMLLMLVGAYVFGSLLVLIRGVQRLGRVAKSPSERIRLTLLLWLGGLTVAASALQVTLLFYFPGGIALPIGGLLQLVFVYFLSQTLLQYRLLDLREIISKAILFVGLVVVIASAYGTLLALFGQVDASFNLLVTLLLASGVVLTLYDPLRREIERLAHRLFFNRRLKLKEELQALERDISTLVSMDLLLDRMMAALQAVPRITRAAIFMWDDASKGYRCQRRQGPDRWPPIQVVPGASPFIDGLRDQGRPYIVEDLERELETEPSEGSPQQELYEHNIRVILATMDELDAEVVVPLTEPDVVLGYLVIKGDEIDEGFTHDEVVLLSELAKTATGVIKTSESLSRLTERERLAALGAMSAGLAHEIRNPLGAIRGAAQFLNGFEVDEEASEFLDIIVEEVDRLNLVVGDFLDYSRPIRVEYAPVDLPAVLNQILKLLEAEGQHEKITLKLDIDEQLPPLLADQAKLKQVFLNLGRNAVQAMPEGGTLIISAHLGDPAGHREHQPTIMIGFKDTGMGIAAQDYPKLFIPFFTTRRKGNGLGLPICQRLIEAHNGSIRVESQVGVGTQFNIRLPVGSQNEEVESLPGAS